MTTVMDGFIFEVTDDQEKIQDMLAEDEPLLCFVLNPDLSEEQLQQTRREGHVVEVTYDNKEVLAVVCGLYKSRKPRPLEIEKLLDTYTRIDILDKLITEPTLCYLLNKALADEKTILKMEQAYTMLDVNHKNENRRAIACAYYTNKEGEENSAKCN